MFKATFVSASSGVSQKGKDWYRVELIADTVSGGAKVLGAFCTENAFRNAQSLQPMQKVMVVCAVTDSGFLTVNGLKGE